MLNIIITVICYNFTRLYTICYFNMHITDTCILVTRAQRGIHKSPHVIYK